MNPLAKMRDEALHPSAGCWNVALLGAKGTLSIRIGDTNDVFATDDRLSTITKRREALRRAGIDLLHPGNADCSFSQSKNLLAIEIDAAPSSARRNSHKSPASGDSTENVCRK